ncbi:MAG: elongation factor G [Myxococcales bacterium]|nr:elongation factor G [Myxococcales bacterium]
MTSTTHTQSTATIPLERFRNVGIMAHVDAGKTTLSERVLYYTGVLRRIGSVDEGTTALDDMPQEQAKGITISAAATTTYWALSRPDGARERFRVNLVDTPGHVDFTIEVERSLRVLDGAVAVFDAAHGVEPQSETVWRQADRYGVPRIAMVNKMDKAGADFDKSVRSMVERLGANAVPVQRPFFEASAFAGVVDLCAMRLVRFRASDGSELVFEPVPESVSDECALAREALIEAVAEHDDEVLNSWATNGPSSVTEAALHRAIRRATIARVVVPVLCGAAAKNMGVQPVLDAIARYLPSPLDRGTIHGTSHIHEDVHLQREPREDQPFSALAFKVVHDPFLGALVFARVYSGTVRRNDAVLEPRKQRRVRVGRVLRIHARTTEEIERAHVGEIVALAGLEGVRTGDTLCDAREPIALESLVIPAPVVQCTVEPVTSADRDKLGPALARLALEDPSLELSTDQESGSTLLGGLGELQLEVTLSRLETNYGVKARQGRPSVAYRETLTRECTIHERFKRQNGGPGLFAEVVLVVRPGARDTGFVFRDETRGGVISRELANAVKKGVEGALTRGPLGGHPVVDIDVTIVDAATHPTDSTALAFEFAGAEAMKRAFTEGAPTRLEPWMALDVVVPEAFVGTVVGDLSARRGRVREVSVRDAQTTVVLGEAPMAALFGYVTDLRGRTHGRGHAMLAFARYERG